MEHRVPHALPHAKLRNEHDRQQHGAHQLDQQAAPHDKARQPHHAAHMMRRNGFLHGAALHQADLFARNHGNGYRHRNHAHAADLNQYQNDRLSELRPVQCGILHHQTGDAHGGGSGEQRVGKVGAARHAARKGKRQQRRAQQNHRSKTGDNDLRGRKMNTFQDLRHNNPQPLLQGSTA